MSPSKQNRNYCDNNCLISNEGNPSSHKNSSLCLKQIKDILEEREYFQDARQCLYQIK
ncbi:MAG TPA: hypothetical protein VKL21_10505 [Candidatus Methanoperedens sp.]|nr:hypothetical protein [Candidatus Methanoperedens sp.]